MKPFDLEKAKAGHPVCTKDGRDVRIICWDMKDEKYPIIALVDEGEGKWEEVYEYTIDGIWDIDDVEASEHFGYNLMLKTKTRTCWTNIYHDGMGNPYNDELFDSEEEAEVHARKNFVQTIKVEWEEE